MERKIKVLVQFSGGKDSLASLIWAVNESGFKKENIEAVFLDTKWEHEETYNHIKEVVEKLQVKLVTLTSKKYDGFVDLAIQKKRFPSTKARFCTEELKVKPMIDYILDECNCHVIIIQGIRKDESLSRSLMEKQCSYFKYYLEPYGKDKKGKDKYYTYRKKEVKEFKNKWIDDVIRPCFDWTGNDVMTYILSAGLKPNPLYYQDAKRVGCFPCIMCSHGEIKAMVKHNPNYIERLKDAEIEMANKTERGSTFFPPNYIPDYAITRKDSISGKKIPTVNDVINYVTDTNFKLDLKHENDNRKCMSVYNICE